MGAANLHDLFKNDHDEIRDHKEKILELLEDEETLKKAALIFEQLINE